ncbi:hypothetical protein [Polyangium jinanense]|uniref:Lipoprotein n=1 Tax=Polyangium jinanense TaxID=2829994 RepID=A0A9X3XCW0_9BACT|nr:hypothetical protein [Polyangium jinanense]MDC3986668.1 hypothetical protein [Polyangium jinanense]
MTVKSMQAAMTLAFVLLAGAACDDPAKAKPSVRRNDAGKVVLREECYEPNAKCYRGCFDRKEERYCPSCCWDQTILCDEGNPYDFDSCKTAETTPTPTRPPIKK